MTDEAKNQVYQILVEECPPGGSIPMTRVGEILREGGVTPQSLGYGKLKKMLEDMPDVVKLSSKTAESGLGQVWYATLLPRKGKKKKAPVPAQAPVPAAAPAPAEAPAAAEAPAPAETPAPVEAPAPAEVPAPAEAPAPVEAVEELPATMDRDEIFFPVAAQKHVSAFLLDQPEAALSRELLEEIQENYLACRSRNGLVPDAAHNSYGFPLERRNAAGNLVWIYISRSTREDGAPWYVRFVKEEAEGESQEPAYKTCRPSAALRKFAYLGNGEAFLRDLAEHVQEEEWSFEGGKPYAILHQYITYTFYRLVCQDKICIADDGSFAAFNTGLQSRRLGEDVFAYFTHSGDNERSPWRFSCFCSTDSGDQGERWCYKKMFSTKGEPEPATYFTHMSDLLLDPDCNVQLSSDHIFHDNCDRLPMDLLKRECSINDEAMGLLAQIEAADNEHQREELFDRLGDVICNDFDLYALLNERLDSALKRTLKRVRRNWKLAVPCFFPTRNVMSMMLPIAFKPTGDPELVLVCERTRSGDYLGQTILTLPMAYVDARLLCRPGSEWLNTQRILRSDDDWDLDDED